VRRLECLILIARDQIGQGDTAIAVEGLERLVADAELPPHHRSAANLFLVEAHRAAGQVRFGSVHQMEVRDWR